MQSGVQRSTRLMMAVSDDDAEFSVEGSNVQIKENDPAEMLEQPEFTIKEFTKYDPVEGRVNTIDFDKIEFIKLEMEKID